MMPKIYLLICLSTLLFATGCKHSKTTAVKPLQQLECAKAIDEPVRQRMTFSTRLSSNVDVVIQPRVSGYLLTKNYTKGTPVKRGQLIYTIDPTQLDLTVESNQAALASARAQLIEADNNYRRAVPLASIDAISQSALDQYRATFAAAQAQVKSAESQLSNSIIERQYASIYAPVDGIIGDTDAVVGDLVGPASEFTTLSTISDISIVSATLSIPIATYMALRGKKADTTPSFDNDTLLTDIQLTLSDGSTYPYNGEYNYTEKNVGSNSGTIDIVVKFPNPDLVLKTGQYGSVSAMVGAAADVVLVPQRAVSQVQGMNSLWIVRPDSTLEYRKVVLGDTFGSDWIVLEGVENGETVVVNGQPKARNGMKIIPVMNASTQKN